jgi:hypothetical protein
MPPLHIPCATRYLSAGALAQCTLDDARRNGDPVVESILGRVRQVNQTP